MMMMMMEESNAGVNKAYISNTNTSAGYEVKSAFFLSKFQDQYIRVCKRTGKKNIRCFPCCTTSGHVQDGYCGQPVAAEITFGLPNSNANNIKGETAANISRLASRELKHQLYCVGEIDACDNQLRFIKGEVVNKSILGIPTAAGAVPGKASLLRTKENYNLPLFKADIVAKKGGAENEVKYNILINVESDPWHYPWHPVRQSAKVNHEFRIYLFIEKEVDKAEAYNFKNRNTKNGTYDDDDGLGAALKQEGFVECVAAISSTPFNVLTSRKSILAKKGLLKGPPGPVNSIEVSRLMDGNDANSEAAGSEPSVKEEFDDDNNINNSNNVDQGETSRDVATGIGLQKRRRSIAYEEEGIKRKRRENSGSDTSQISRENIPVAGKLASFGSSSSSSSSSNRMDAMLPQDTESQRKIKTFYKLMESFMFGNFEADRKAHERSASSSSSGDPSAISPLAGTKKLSNIEEFSSILLGEFVAGVNTNYSEMITAMAPDTSKIQVKNEPVSSIVNQGNYNPSSNLSSSAVSASSMSAQGNSAPVPSGNDAEVTPKAFRGVLAKDLTEFLLNESSFTDSVSQFFRECRNSVDHENESVDKLFQKFFSIVLEHIDGFLQSRNITFEQLEGQLSVAPKNPIYNHFVNQVDVDSRFDDNLKGLRLEFLQRLQKKNIPDHFTSGLSQPVDKRFDLEGTWVYIGEDGVEDEAVQSLNRFGFPGFLLKLARGSMMRSTININKDWFYWEGSEKLMHQVRLLFALDGKVHTWVLPQIVPLALPVRVAKYVAYIDEEKGCVFLDQFGSTFHDPTREIHWIRELRLSDDGVEMFINTRLEVVDNINNTKEVIATIFNPYLRVWRKNDTDNLLQDTTRI